MIIWVNCKEMQLDDSATVEMLVSQCGVKAQAIVVERNGVILQQEVWPQTLLTPGDRLELVTFVGGGD